MKQLNFNETVYSATKKYPELIGIIAEMGFPQVKNSLMRNTLGKQFTINQAIEKANLNRAQMIQLAKSKGFEIQNG